jgi:transcriptional regulator with XRE-family HTH domain
MWLTATSILAQVHIPVNGTPVSMDRFGEKLRALRERHNMTQDELGKLSGFKRDYITSIEIGRRKPNSQALIRIADIFGVTLDQLMRDELDV